MISDGVVTSSVVYVYCSSSDLSKKLGVSIPI